MRVGALSVTLFHKEGRSTQDPSPAVGVNGIRLVWAGANNLHEFGGGKIKDNHKLL